MATAEQKVKFTQEDGRPIAELLRDIEIDLRDVLARYYPLAINNESTDPIEENRGGEGVADITEAQLATLMGKAEAIRNSLQEAGVASMLAQIVIRPYQRRR